MQYSPLQFFQEAHFDKPSPSQLQVEKLALQLSKPCRVTREALEGSSVTPIPHTIRFLWACSALLRCLFNTTTNCRNTKRIQDDSVWLKEMQILWKITRQIILIDVIWWLMRRLLLRNYESRTVYSLQ